MVMMAAADEAELKHMVATQAAFDAHPSALRYPRGEGVGVELPAHGTVLDIGKGRILREGGRICLLSYGTRLQQALLAADRLDAQGFRTSVVDARFMKPLDEALIQRLAREHEILLTLEEGAIGGFGSHVMHMLAQNGLLEGGLKMRSLTLPDIYIDHDKPDAMYDMAGLNAAQIIDAVKQLIGSEADHLVATPKAGE
jgi:1-deoxy-D-xylulose-5-phosphate synthase